MLYTSYYNISYVLVFISTRTSSTRLTMYIDLLLSILSIMTNEVLLAENTTLGETALDQKCTWTSKNNPCAALKGRNTLFTYSQLSNSQMTQLTPEAIQVEFNNIDSILADSQGNADCATAWKHVICLAGAPPCDIYTVSNLLPVCTNSCLAYARLQNEGKCDSLIRYSQEHPLSDFNVVAHTVSQFDCFNVSSYYHYNDLHSIIDQQDCTDLFKEDQKERILTGQNQCVPIPTNNLCNATFLSSYSHYIPLNCYKETENFLDYLKVVEMLEDKDNGKCSNAIISLGCYLTFPPCDPDTGDALPLCLETCNLVNSFLQPCIAMLFISNSKFSILARNFNCSIVSSYLPTYLFLNFTQCVNGTNLVNQIGPATEIPVSRADSRFLGGPAVVGAFFIILMIIILLLVICRKRLKLCCQKQQLPNGCERMLRSGRGSDADRLSSLNSNISVEDMQQNTLKRLSRDSIDELELLSETDRQSYEKVFSSILVPYTSLTVGTEIGQGAFGKVYKGEIRREGSRRIEDVAIKTIKNLSSRNEVEAFFEESILMMDFKHPNILGLAGVCFDTPDGVPFIILPYMANGSLKDFLKKKRTHLTNVNILPEGLTLPLLAHMCLDIANGMKYLAGEKFVHRDLAARNCMIDTKLIVKVGDFGLARDIYMGEYYRANAGARLPVKWMAPETLHDAISNEKTDVWSFGVTCWETFSLGRSPYPGIENQDILQHISNNHRLKRPSLCPEKLFDVTMSPCWKLLPEERPTFSQLACQLQEYWEEEHAYVIENIGIIRTYTM